LSSAVGGPSPTRRSPLSPEGGGGGGGTEREREAEEQSKHQAAERDATGFREPRRSRESRGDRRSPPAAIRPRDMNNTTLGFNEARG